MTGEFEKGPQEGGEIQSPEKETYKDPLIINYSIGGERKET